MCALLVACVLFTPSVTLCEFIGCFADSKCCQKKWMSLLNKLFEIVVWATILCGTFQEVERPANDSYVQTWPDWNDAVEHAADTREELDSRILWIEYTLDMPEWLSLRCFSRC